MKRTTLKRRLSEAIRTQAPRAQWGMVFPKSVIQRAVDCLSHNLAVLFKPVEVAIHEIIEVLATHRGDRCFGLEGAKGTFESKEA